MAGPFSEPHSPQQPSKNRAPLPTPTSQDFSLWESDVIMCAHVPKALWKCQTLPVWWCRMDDLMCCDLSVHGFTRRCDSSSSLLCGVTFASFSVHFPMAFHQKSVLLPIFYSFWPPRSRTWMLPSKILDSKSGSTDGLIDTHKVLGFNPSRMCWKYASALGTQKKKWKLHIGKQDLGEKSTRSH